MSHPTPTATTPDKKIILDDDKQFEKMSGSQLAAERAEKSTPGALAEKWAADRRTYGLPEPQITKSAKPFKDWARVDVEAKFTATHLSLHVEVTCNPEYMCDPHDLVPVYLERDTNNALFMIALLQPTRDTNYQTFDFDYPLVDLARALSVPVDTLTSRSAAVELGVLAQWLADTKGVNGPNHVSGGVLEKGGSGKVLLRAVTGEELAKTEASQRNTEWNMAERLTPDRSRPVLSAFGDILSVGKEMATTLEAESEFEVDKDTLARITQRLEELKARVDEAQIADAKFDFRGTRRRPERPYEIWSMTDRSTKVYTDIYFDIVGADSAFPLLSQQIVLRRRMVVGDPAGTYLCTLKGRTVTEERSGERIRLAAQVNLVDAAMTSSTGFARLAGLLRDQSVDNAFGRVFGDMVTHCGLQRLLAGPWTLAPVLTVVSKRVKYGMKLEDSTVIEFSGDEATGRAYRDGDMATFSATIGATDRTATVHSFEFGVGHPGLAAGGTATGTASVTARARQTAATGRVTRPYHVPKDLENPALFKKMDHGYFVRLRDALLHHVFKLDKSDLTAGGSKGSELARRLNLFTT